MKLTGNLVQFFFSSYATIREATEEAIRFLLGKDLKSEVPREEFDVQSQEL